MFLLLIDWFGVYCIMNELQNNEEDENGGVLAQGQRRVRPRSSEWIKGYVFILDMSNDMQRPQSSLG